MARLKSVHGVAAVFDTDIPERHAIGASPTLVLQHISDVPEKTIAGDIHTDVERYQVSVRGAKLASVRTVARRVIDALHGYQSDTIKRVDYESWPGTIRGDADPLEFHAPVDFMVRS